ncbi:hypothetical protein NECAME_09816 [Necator americanus]|uniref:Uncharacterized protein n=1 Tax=Necator americanus TaxID=51031 RepID=W2TCX6_NECAM|nr:hypothetical protein NECAME_09816 [Necator americanus]ETN79449.1 hypothetical protein NECAME_09816 [Necator americanus]
MDEKEDISRLTNIRIGLQPRSQNNIRALVFEKFRTTCAFTCLAGEIKIRKLSKKFREVFVRDGQVLNCLTDTGTVLELGTTSYVENGVEYSCTGEEDPVYEGSGEEISVNNCPDNADGSDDITIGNFLICCVSRRFKGCFNGSRTDDVEDVTFHVKKYTVWRQGDRRIPCMVAG